MASSLAKAWIAALAMFAAGAALAAPVALSFTATNFAPGAPPPVADPVSGTIVYDAPSTTSPIGALISVSLVIDGHAYALAEVGFDNQPGVTYIGGLIDGVLGSGNFEDDFLLGWDTAALTPLVFLYAVSGSDGLWITADFSTFVVSAVDEPGALACAALSLLMLAASMRRSRARAAEPMCRSRCE